MTTDAPHGDLPVEEEEWDASRVREYEAMHGHRLGALVKAAVLRQVVATRPEVRRITTHNSDSNAPMVAVNEALGFAPAGHLSSWSRRL